MPLCEALKEIDKTLYPDIAEAGSLDIAISKHLSALGSRLVAEGTETSKVLLYARVEAAPRFSQIYIAAEQRLFLFDFWSEGVLFGNASCENIIEVARSIHAWIADKLSLEQMSRMFVFFSPSESGKAHEAGIFVEHKWQALLENWRVMESSFSTPDYAPTRLIEAAMKRPQLRQLFPYTSLTRLCFSRTTGFPFTKDCPSMEPQGNGKYIVYMPISHEAIDELTAEETIEIAIKHLPPNCGPAINGTAEDFDDG